jgi:hypothetical protein
MTRRLGPLVALFVILSAATAAAQDWGQWGRDAQHTSASDAAGRRLERIEAEIVLDPFVDPEVFDAGGDLLIHFPVPLSDGDDLYLIEKGGTFTGRSTRQTMTWSVKNVRRTGSVYATRWKVLSDWKPLPLQSNGNGPVWEQVFQPALTADAVWAPAAGGTLLKLGRADGATLARINPFGPGVDPTIYTAGPPAIDDAGNVYYDAVKLAASGPYATDVVDSWLVRVDTAGNATKATFASLLPGAPAANAPCTTAFLGTQLPFPPSPQAVAPTAACGSQRPGFNVTPAIAPDGTIYTISRAHFNDRWGTLIAVKPDLTTKWSASLRNRLSDGCNVLIPPNGTPGGCRAGAATGVDPSENQLGSGRVNDDSTSSPVVAPDGRILYGAYTRYNYAQGHLMSFSAAGDFLFSYPWGWDLSPAVYRHDGTYSVILKENHYDTGSYCNTSACPPRSALPSDDEAYYVTQLDASLKVEWKFKSTNTESCARQPDGALQCFDDHPYGFEWCVNAIVVDRNGLIYANSEDGSVYAIGQGGVLRQSLFLRLALGAAYTPLSVGRDGRVYTQNDGKLYVVSDIEESRRRAVRH